MGSDAATVREGRWVRSGAHQAEQPPEIAMSVDGSRVGTVSDRAVFGFFCDPASVTLSAVERVKLDVTRAKDICGATKSWPDA
jgi:hypothetical protein